MSRRWEQKEIQKHNVCLVEILFLLEEEFSEKISSKNF